MQISLQINIMHKRSESFKPTHKQYMLRVNQIINSIYAINQPLLETQLQTCQHIVGELLHNDLISHIQSVHALRLLAYELVLFLAEEESVNNKPKLEQMEDHFDNNKKIKLTASLRHVLDSIKLILEEMIWKSSKKNQGKEIGYGKGCKIYQYFLQFSNLLDEYDRQLSQTSLEQSPSDKLEDDLGNEALIEQLEEIIAKKQGKIKELREELEENILDQKSLEDLVDQLQLKNGQLNQEIGKLTIRIKEGDKNLAQLEEKIEELRLQNRRLETERKRERRQTYKGLSSAEDYESDEVIKKNINLINLGGEKKKKCSNCIEKQVSHNMESEEMRRFLLIQSLSIEAMI